MRCGRVCSFTFFRKTTVIPQWLTMDALSNIDDLVIKLGNEIKECRQKLAIASKYRLHFLTLFMRPIHEPETLKTMV